MIICYTVPEIWCVMDVIFIFYFGLIFCPFTTLTTQKTKTLKKWKKTPGDIIILHTCSINNNHTMYGSWNMKCDGQNFLSFWTMSCSFNPAKTWKIKILKKWKKTPRDIIILHKCPKNHYATLFLRYDAWWM